MQVITNNHYRDILSWYDLTAREQSNFDYLDTEESKLDASFIRYRGEVYDLSEFVMCRDIAWNNDFFKNWDGYQSDTYFSGILVRYSSDHEAVCVARYYS